MELVLLAEISIKIKLLRTYESGSDLLMSDMERKQIKNILSNCLGFGQLKKLLVGSSPGSVLWLVGWLVNVHSDHILRNLRKSGETGYKIPTGKVLHHETLVGIMSYTTAKTTKTPITFTEGNLCGKKY